MKAPVIRAFRDKKNNGKYVKAKSVYEGTEERIKELQGKGFLGEEVESDNNENGKQQEPSILDGTVEEVKKNADGLTVEEVKEL